MDDLLHPTLLLKEAYLIGRGITSIFSTFWYPATCVDGVMNMRVKSVAVNGTRTITAGTNLFLGECLTVVALDNIATTTISLYCAKFISCVEKSELFVFVLVWGKLAVLCPRHHPFKLPLGVFE